VLPLVETLEERAVPAVSINSAGNLVVEGTTGHDYATVTETATSYKVNLNGVTTAHNKALVRGGRVYFYGYEGNDGCSRPSTSSMVPG
jgi:hypothetical protein